MLKRSIQVPVGVKVSGSVINILGDPHEQIDESEGSRWLIHRDVRRLCSRVVVDEVLRSGIKVIDKA